MTVYKTEEGQRRVRSAVRRLYEQWPVPCEHGTCTDPEEREAFYIRTTNAGADAPVLVLLHGTSSNSAGWMGYVHEWSRHFTIYAVDLPGQPGLSTDVRPSLSDGAMRRWIISLLDRLELRQLAVCGMSLGGLIAVDLAIHHPERVSGVAVIAGSGFHRPRVGFLLRALPLMLLGERGTRRINRIVHGKVPVEPAVEEFSILVAKHFRQLTEELPVFSNEQLRTLQTPLLYIGGTRDALVNVPASADRIRRLVPHAVTRELDTGHVILDQGEYIRDFLLGAIEQQAGAPARR